MSEFFGYRVVRNKALGFYLGEQYQSDLGVVIDYS